MEHDHRPGDDLSERLRADRPQLDSMGLDRLHRTVVDRAANPSSRKAGFLKSRLALIAVLATGIVMSTTGATLAVTGIAGDNDASVSQYSGVLGTQTSGGGGGGGDQSPSSTNGGGGGDTGDGGSTGSDPQNDTLGEQTSGSNDPASNVRTTSQVAAGSGKSALPFTGLAVFPLLIGGVALLLTGAFMRRQSRVDAV